jgi:hypothetical protein
LIEILKALFCEIDQNLSGWFGKKARTKTIIKGIITRLEQMHQAPDSQSETVKETSGQETAKHFSGELGGQKSGVKAKLGGGGSTRSNASVAGVGTSFVQTITGALLISIAPLPATSLSRSSHHRSLDN